ncbi:hypothetical protein GCM10009687_56220 [Asanoa iriomotensis]|uniref:Uncharacterized protein n=2 Tax=Asanoa iriomotensis TaxID=234613 RepID=A0ABQ4CFT7_9ACTN|nr:hypothetical protein Air01nite_77360 [Asanoa iriomotensis]
MSDTAMGLRTHHLVKMRPPKSPGQSYQELAEIHARAEHQALVRGELFYVDPPMMELAVAASATLPDFRMNWEDIPAPEGLIYLGKPVAALDEDRSQVFISAISWYAWKRVAILTYYADRDSYVSGGYEHFGRSLPPAFFFTSGAITFPESSESMAAEFHAGPDDRNLSAAEMDEINGMANLMAVLKTVWLLMFQPLADVTIADVSRPAPAQATRPGRRPSRIKDQVRVIQLRRPPSTGAGASDREYHHQWMVRGHWRQQWYPVRQVHRPIWIAPHVKGPEGRPLLGGEKVYHWKR